MRIKQYKPRYLVKDFTCWVIGEMAVQKVSQEEMGKLLGITQPAMRRKLEIGKTYDEHKDRCPFSFRDFCIIIDKLQPEDEKVLKFIRI